MTRPSLQRRVIDAVNALYHLENELDTGNPLDELEYDHLRRLVNRWRIDTARKIERRKIERELSQYENPPQVRPDGPETRDGGLIGQEPY